ncbi:MAG: aspartate kinase [Synergistaceae bacterium]|jgi:aspartate kinase|nr:aspartate kinase [Synergistaceae bacterium]
MTLSKAERVNKQDDKKIAVLKFGGSSVADSQRMRKVAAIIIGYQKKGYLLAVIVSAMGNTTNDLLALAQDVSDESGGREIDQLLATGEQQSVALLALALNREGIPAQSFTASQAGFYANGFPTEGRIYRVDPKGVIKAMEEGKVAVVAGFQAITDSGDVITLGRGGSDLSAVALAAAIGGECHLLKDVAGVMSADPKVVKAPIKLKHFTYQECMELSSLGAKMLQARSVEVASRYEVPLYVASSFVDEEGTWIVKSNPVSEGLAIKGVVHDLKVAKVVMMGVPDVPGVAGRLFSSLADKGIGAEMILQNNMRGGLNDIGFLVKKEFLDGAIDVCRDFSRDIGAQGVSFNTEIARVSIVGAGIANHPDIPSRMFTVLAEEGINIDMIASTALTVTCIVASPRAEDAVRALHEHFIEEGAV